MSVDVDWEYEDITLERVCFFLSLSLSLSLSVSLWVCARVGVHSIHLHVIIAKLPTAPVHIYKSPLIRRSVAYSSRESYGTWFCRSADADADRAGPGQLYLCTGTTVHSLTHSFADTFTDSADLYAALTPQSRHGLTLQNNKAVFRSSDRLQSITWPDERY